MKFKPNSASAAGIIFLFSLLLLPACFADTIVLNDGKKVEGIIVEKAESFIKVEVEGVDRKIYNREIKEIIPRKEELVIAGDRYAELEKNSLLNKVFELSNVKKQIESIPVHVAEEYAQFKERIPEDKFEAGSRIVLQAYSADNIYSSIVDYFNANYRRDYLLKIKEFMSSTLSEKIVGLEEKATGSKGFEGMKEFADTLSKNPPPTERTELIKRLDDAVGATNMQIETVIALYKGINLAIDPVVSADRRLTPGELDMVAAQMRKELKNILKNVISISFLYTYQSLSDDELKQYLAFWSSDAGKWFNKTSNGAFIAAMDKASKTAISEFAKLGGNDEADNQEESLFYKRGGEWIRK